MDKFLTFTIVGLSLAAIYAKIDELEKTLGAAVLAALHVRAWGDHGPARLLGHARRA